MSEILVPRYYNTKINNHDWVIYMGGERYFPAYPAKWVEPGEKIVKRYLIIDSSKNHNYDDGNYNRYPLSLLEAFINENDETIQFNGGTYYLWKAYNQRGNSTELEKINEYGSDDANLYLLTTTLEPKLPLTEDSQELAYLIASDTMENWKDYMMNKHICVAQINEYEDGKRKVKMANICVRMYKFEHNNWLIDEDPYGRDMVFDYFQYDGEMVEYEGQRCFVWYRYDDNEKCTIEGIHEDHFGKRYKMQKILTNTLWISSLPFTMDSPEFVTWISYEDVYNQEPMDMPFDRIEYLSSTEYVPIPIDMTYTEFESIIDINVYTRLHDEQFVPFEDERNLQYVYDGETTEWNGKTCYVWRKPDLHDETYFPYIILTNTMDITLPFNHDAEYFEAALNYNDEPVEYMNMGENTFGGAGKKATFIIRNNATHYDPPIYKTVTNIIVK